MNPFSLARPASHCATTLLVLIGYGSPASAQVTTTGNIRVAATDQAGLPIPGATVTAAAEDAATTRVAFTDAAGLAELRALAPSARYVVTVELSGFRTTRQADILVRAGQTASLALRLPVGSVTETVVVTAAPPVVDVRSAVVAEDITLDLTEAVPTGRSYQSYLQLVPGVLPDDPDSPGNPASKSGLNYRDIGGDAGVSRDNFYYIDGINVTDGVSGTFGANLNTEIIQEQQVLTGGIPAEYVGAPGLLSSVVTRSGTNQLAGSVNYFFQNERRTRRREPECLGPGVLAVRHRAHRRRSHRGRRGVVLRQLSARGAQRHGGGPRRGRRHPHRRTGPGPVLRPRHVGAEHERHPRVHVPERPYRHQRQPRPRCDERAGPKPGPGGQQLPPEVHPPVRPSARRGFAQPAQRRAVRLRGGARSEQQHRLPRHRRPHARGRAARRLRARRPRPARHRGLQGHRARAARPARDSWRSGVHAEYQSARHRVRRRAVHLAGGAAGRARGRRADRGKLHRYALRSDQQQRLQRVHPHRRRASGSGRVLRPLRPEPGRRDLPGRARRRPGIRQHGREPPRGHQLRPALPVGARRAADPLERPEPLPAGHVQRHRPPVVQRRRPHRALRARRDRRHEHLHLRLDAGPAPQRVVRPHRQRPATAGSGSVRSTASTTTRYATT